MAYIMDFNSVWPLLRKEGWTWKPATSIQIQCVISLSIIAH
ncbi:hypothetical protein PI125_g17830 [Phytophthora idaei]|nr:hypothetical protein PI125_g17830 [Phytophthora idaei]KAG3157867.1 hypothetical protein PI126_g8108 [Phytophthora idaei]